MVNRKDWHKLTFKKNDVCFRSENIHFGTDLEVALFSYRYNYTQSEEDIKKFRTTDPEKEKTEYEKVFFYFHSTFKVLKDMCDDFIETNPGLLEQELDINKITGDERLKEYVFGQILGEGANAIVYACKDGDDVKGALK
jgi:hypothetical protein